MSRCSSPRKKAISPIAVVDSDDEDFLAVASDVASNDQYLFFFYFYNVTCKFSRFIFFYSKEVDDHDNHPDAEC